MTCWPSPPWPIAMRPARRPCAPRPRSTPAPNARRFTLSWSASRPPRARFQPSSDRATSSSGRRTPSDCARTGSVVCSGRSGRPATVSAGRWRWVSRRSALLACCSGSCPARCRSVALQAPPADRRRGRPRSRRSSRRWGRLLPLQQRRKHRQREARPRSAGASAPAAQAGASAQPGASPQPAVGLRFDNADGAVAIPAPTRCGHVQPARRRRRRSGPHLALRGFDRRLGADRHLGDAAHHRARAVRPALDLAPLRRLTTGRPARAVPDGSRRDPPVHLGTCPPNV